MTRAATKAPAKAGARRSRSGLDIEEKRSTAQVLLRLPRELHAAYSAIAESEDGMSLQEWLREAAEWHARRSVIRPRPGQDDLDAGNPLQEPAKL